MDKNYLGFTDQEHSLLLRLMDDFLFITTSKSDAERFLEVMKKGMPEYGCFISTQKTLTNFKYRDTKVLESPEFPWCGHLINTKTLNFTIDYGRYHGTHIGDTLTVDITKSPGLAFRQRMFQAVRVRMSMIYLDTGMNSVETVRLNIYQALLLVATKYVAYLNDWKANVVKSYKFFHDVIEKTIGFLCISVQRQSEQKYVIDAGGICSVKAFEITWLGRQAFAYILSRRPHKFRVILRLLKIDLEKQSKRCFARRTAHNLHKTLRSKSNRVFKGIKY